MRLRNEVEDKSLLKAIKHKIEEDLSQPLDAKALAISFAISEYRLQQLFERYEGGTLVAYQKRRRMDKAGDYLIRTLMPVGEIARAVGYESHSKFARAFTECKGESPLRFRETHHH